MRIFTERATALFYEKIKSLQAKPTSWRVIHIAFAANPDFCSDTLRTNIVTDVINDLLEQEDGFIYLCEDGDAFILFQGQAKPIVERLGYSFQDLGAKADTRFYTLYDLSNQWDIFLPLCERKHAEINPSAVISTSEQAPNLPVINNLKFALAAKERMHRKRLTVLLIEDDTFIRRLISSALRNNYNILEAGSGTSAITQYENAAPDAVFLDIQLPDTNGHTILKTIMKHDPSAFIVMLSANSIKENILAALEEGAQGFVAKPFAKEKLMHYLHNCEILRKSCKLSGVAHV